MPESDRRCGMGGSFRRQKREGIRSTGWCVVATGGPAWRRHITDSLSPAGDALTVKHPLELYAASLEGS
jgi:Fe-S oxidoreductase